MLGLLRTEHVKNVHLSGSYSLLLPACILANYHCTHIDDDVIIQYYPNPNYKNGTRFGVRNSKPTTLVATRRIWGRVVATIVGLGFLDTALYLKQY